MQKWLINTILGYFSGHVIFPIETVNIVLENYDNDQIFIADLLGS